MSEKGTQGFHSCKNNSILTPYEQKIHDLKQEGKTWAEIAELIGKGSLKTVASRYTIIKEKLASLGWENEA